MKLLSDQNLRQEIDAILDYNHKGLAIKNLMDVLHSQKIAHGDMVIGLDSPDDFPDEVTGLGNGINALIVKTENNLRARQRGVNK